LNAVLSSLAAFLAALVRPPTPLARAIRLVLVIKLIAIAGIGMVMVPAARHGVNASAVLRLIAPPPSPSNHQER
jgi:hypothetical protein